MKGLGLYEERTTPPVLSGIARCLTTLFPSLKEVKVVRAWAGIMGFTADGLPLIGRYDAVPGLTLAAGFNGGGFSWGAITGKVIARLLTDQDPGYDLTPFTPTRFHGGITSWNNPFTAGERATPYLSQATSDYRGLSRHSINCRKGSNPAPGPSTPVMRWVMPLAR